MEIKLIILIILNIFIFSGCTGSVYVDDGVPRTETGEAITSNETNAIRTTPISDFYLEVAEAEYNKYSYIHKFGKNNRIDSGSGFEAIWGGGGDYTGFPAESETLEISSNNANDVFGGTGAWTIKITKLMNSSCHYQPDVYINLNGTNWVTIDSNLYHRASRMSVYRAGTSEFNEGEITLRHTTTTANIFAVMPAEYGQTMITALTIPADHKGFLNSWYASMGNKARGVSTIRLMMRPINQAWQIKEEFSISADGSSYVNRQYKVPKDNIHGCTDIKVMADSDTNELSVAAGMDFILEARE